MNLIYKTIMKFFSLITELNFVWVVLCVALFFQGEKALVGKIIIAILLVYAINTGVIKTVINRRRPYQDDGETLDADMIEPYGSSFPSNHTTVAATVTTLLFINGNEWFMGALVLTVAIIVSKLGLKLNYKSDIVAGTIIGVILGFVANFFMKIWL